MLRVGWATCGLDGRCNLDELDLSSIRNITGVYLIWHGGNTPQYVKVGQGDITQRLAAHLLDEKTTQYREIGGLYGTWARVQEDLRNGVEVYLAKTCNPLVGSRFPDAKPVEVNLPGM